MIYHHLFINLKYYFLTLLEFHVYQPMMASSEDVVAVWSVSLADGVHQVKFEHGTTTGKRVLYVDNKEVFRKNWMFKLVGRHDFEIGKTCKAQISIDASSGFAYSYTLYINGKPLEKFTENRKHTSKVWTLQVDGEDTRIVLGMLLKIVTRYT